MKYSFVFVLSLFFLSSTHARFVRFWPYTKLVDNAELVAVAEVATIEKANVPWEGQADSKRFQSHVAHLKIAWVIKGDQKIKNVDLLFFTYADPRLQEDDGRLFIDFQHVEKHQYLIFLKKDVSGRFVPTTGHDDASISVKEINQDSFSRIIDTGLPKQGE